jgi:hypothetical protein
MEINKNIITELNTRHDFYKLNNNNPGLIIIKLGATWCNPCKLIEQPIKELFNTMPENVICCNLDVDECFDFYALLKSKKMVSGIPVLLCYKHSNNTSPNYIPDDSISGTNLIDINNFFERCIQTHLPDVQKNLNNKYKQC